MKTKPKFKVGDTVIATENGKGKSTTITGVIPQGHTFVYMGFYCGKLITFHEANTLPYR